MTEKEMTLGIDWLGEDAAGWYASEKLDGVRAYWDGANLWTRSGNIIRHPWSLPAGVHLDGEVWAGRGQFQAASEAVRLNHWTSNVHYVVHDGPQFKGDWCDRITVASAFWPTVSWQIAPADEMAVRLMALKVFNLGGEGLVLRKPGAGYVRGRTNTLLKVK